MGEVLCEASLGYETLDGEAQFGRKTLQTQGPEQLETQSSPTDCEPRDCERAILCLRRGNDSPLQGPFEVAPLTGQVREADN